MKLSYPTPPPIDLNLVRVFVAIYETGGVSLAANRLCVTQPSVSYALARLRTLLGDALICGERSVGGPLRKHVLFGEQYVCLLSRRHPRIGAELTLPQYLAERHVVVSKTGSHHPVEDCLRERNQFRKISLRLAHVGALPEVIAGSDMLTTLPSRLAAQFAQVAATRRLRLPFPGPAQEASLSWHEQATDPGARRRFGDFVRHTVPD